MSSNSLILTTNSTDPSHRLDLATNHSLIDPHTVSTDLLIVASNTQKIGIDQARSVKKFLSTTPFTHDHKVTIIPFAQDLTTEAQNSLLKTLEEPASFAQIILITNSTDNLLPTIVSRCQVIHSLKNQPDSKDTLPNFGDFLSLPPSQRLTITDSHANDTTTAKDFCSNSIHHFRTQLKQDPGNKNLFNLTLSLYCHKLLTQNINPKLTIDYLLLNLKPSTISSK